MVEQVLKDIFRIEVPLPRSPLKYLNSWVIKGGGRFLIVDTGMNRPECKEALLAGLKDLEVDPDKCDFFMTHLHADHCGLCGIAPQSSKVYFAEKDALGAFNVPVIGAPEYHLYAASGFPIAEMDIALKNHPGNIYGPTIRPFTFIVDGQKIDIGDYHFECFMTPGHTPAHMCLLDREKKVLIGGDHILIDITPNITNWMALPNPLKHYISSLDRVYALDLDLVLPGHRRIVREYRERIDELKAHHQARLAEIVRGLESGAKDVYHIAPYVTWDIKVKNWAAFPPQQKWFAFGETLAHLAYLEGDGKVRRVTEKGHITFELV